MQKRNNAATRLHRAISEALARQESHMAAVEVWAFSFGINAPDVSKLIMEVSERLIWLNSQLNEVVHQLEVDGVEASTFDFMVVAVRRGLLPVNLDSQFLRVREQMTSQSMSVLALVGAAILKDEEHQVEPEVLSSLADSARELRLLAADSTISPPLRDLISRHVALIDDAILKYPYFGAKVFHDCAVKGYGDIALSREVLGATDDQQIPIKLVKIWEALCKVADMSNKSEALIKLGHKATELLTTAIGS